MSIGLRGPEKRLHRHYVNSDLAGASAHSLLQPDWLPGTRLQRHPSLKIPLSFAVLTLMCCHQLSEAAKHGPKPSGIRRQRLEVEETHGRRNEYYLESAPARHHRRPSRRSCLDT